MKKRVLSLLLALVMVISMFPAALAAESGFAPKETDTALSGPLDLTQQEGVNAPLKEPGEEETTFAPVERGSQSAPGTVTKAENDGKKLAEGEKTRFSESEAATTYEAGDVVTFIVVTKDEPLLSVYSTGDIAAQTASVQRHERKQISTLNSVKSKLEKAFGEEESFALGYTYTVATSAVAVTTEYGNKAEIEAMSGVDRVYVAPVFSLPKDEVGGAYDPLTSNASTMIGANVLNASGYTGKGTKIAIIDTGIVLNHPSFGPLTNEQLTEDSMTQASVQKVWDSLNASQRAGSQVNNTYYNTKIPFRFNYYSGSFDVSHYTSDHGTHVAGIAAANKVDGSSVIGVAPEAQLVVMQVFTPQGGANWAEILAALEDCVRLGVDTANLSLGMAAGFTDTDEMIAVMDQFKDTDIQVLIAAGNDTNNAYQNLFGMNMSLSSDPDNGLVGTPSTYSAALSVASADNNGAEQLYFTVNGRKIGYSDTAINAKLLTKFKDQTLEFVPVPGYGEASDYSGLDVEGKVALVSRGSTSFLDKQKEAKEHGAIACVVYNNATGVLNMQISETIPCVAISQADGAYMREQYEAGETKLTVCGGDLIKVNYDNSMSDFSSWGPTPDLKLKPEITGVGGSIYSSVDPEISGSSYGTMSGTSMASPQIAGAMAVLMQYLREKYPELKDEALRQTAANLLMSTANPILEGEVEFSPRNQGAGLADLVKATKSSAYLSNPAATEGRPKAELGESSTGSFSFDFTITNMSGGQPLTYNFDSSLLAPALVDGKFMGNSDVALDGDVTVTRVRAASFLFYDFNDDGQVTTADARVLLRHVLGSELVSPNNQHYEYLDVNGDGEVNRDDVQVMLTYFAELPVEVDLLAGFKGGEGEEVTSVTVPAGETVELTATITLSQTGKSYIENGFENGTYVEGYLYANAEDADGVNLAMPFLGFYGDWSKAPVFDRDDMVSLYEKLAFTNSGVLLGENPYIRGGKSGDEYNAFSYSNPLDEIDFGMLRNAKRLDFVVTDDVTGEEYFKLTGYDIAKSYYNPNYGQIIPFMIYNASPDEEAVWHGYDKNGEQLKDGTKVTYTVNAYLDDGDEIVDDTWSFGVRLDNYAPEIRNQYELKAETDAEGHTTLTLDLWDNQYIAAVLFINSKGVIMGKYLVDNTPGEADSYTFDITGYGSDFTILVGDYACNETEIDVSLGLENADTPVLKKLDKNRIYGCETYDAAAVDAGWFSANKQDLSDPKNETFDNTSIFYSGEYVNGYVMAQSAATGDLVLLTPNSTYWDQQTLVSQNGKTIGEAGVWVLYDMALDYSGKGSAALGYDWVSTSAMLAVGWQYAGDQDGDGKDDGYNALFQVELYSNGYIDVEAVAKITGTEDGAELLTLGCTTEGQLYGIDTNGKLYKVSFDGKCELVGTTDFVNELNYSGCNVIQSMGYDHNTGTMYWFAHSQTIVGNHYVHTNKTYTVNLETAECTEVGTYGPGGQTALFIPTDRVSDLFTMGVDPTGFEVSPYEMTMAVGQTERLEVTWKPWNAKATPMTWSSSDEEVATVNSAGYVTALSEGDVVITATAQILDWDGSWVDWTATTSIRVVGSAEGIYGYVVSDFANNTNNFAWYTYSDQTPGKISFITRQELTTTNEMGETVTGNALWQGGAYYNGYVYTVDAEIADAGDGTVGAASVLYRSKVTKGATPAKTTIGEPERIGAAVGIEVGNLGFDYTTGRMYCVSYSDGGLGIIDLDTGAVDLLGTFSGDIGGPAIATAMCVTADGTIVISDMYGNLYTVDCDTLSTKRIGSTGEDCWYYAGMTYDYNTGNIYWNPCMGSKLSPLYLVRLDEDQWSHETKATLVKLGSVSSKAGVEQTVMFTIPDNEPETQQIPTKSITITNGDVIGLVGGSLQLTAVTEPLRPTVQAKTWTSSDESIVTVDRYGKLTFQGVGEAVVTVSISNKNPADGGPHTAKVHVTVYESAGLLTAFLASDEGGGSGYYEYWLDLYDYAVQAAKLETRVLGVYNMRSGTYYDGYFYGYNRDLKFMRVDASNRLDYAILTDGPAEGLTAKDDYGKVKEQVTAMAYDYTTSTMYGLTLPVNKENGYLATIDLETGAVNKLYQLDAKVFALAIDDKGTLYAAGSLDSGADAVLYTVDKTTGVCTKVMDLTGARVYTGENNYGDAYYNAQMTYDFTTGRLYLNATASGRNINRNSGVFMIDLGKNLLVNLGKPALDNGRSVKVGTMYLGLLCAIPEANELPESDVNGVLISKESARVAVDGTITLTARVRPSNATEPGITWTSSDETVAAVDENGVVTGVSAGAAVITAASTAKPDIKASCTVTVVALDGPQSVGYTVSARKDSLVRFNPELPGTTAEIISEFSGGSSIAGMDISGDTLWYLVNTGSLPQLYRYDLTSKQTTACGQLYTFGDGSDMAYDAERNAVYVSSGFYVFKFDVDKLTAGSLNWYSDSRDISNLTGMPATHGVAVANGAVYFLGKGYNGLNLYKLPINEVTGAFDGTPEEVLSNLPLSTDSKATEMAYDSSKDLFYITDAADRLYSLDWNGDVTLIDSLGDGLDINGLAIAPAVGE